MYEGTLINGLLDLPTFAELLDVAQFRDGLNKLIAADEFPYSQPCWSDSKPSFEMCEAFYNNDLEAVARLSQ